MVDRWPIRWAVWVSPAFVAMLCLFVLCDGKVGVLGLGGPGFFSFLPIAFVFLAIIIIRQQKLIERLQEQLKEKSVS